MEEQKKRKYAFWLNADTKGLVEDCFQKDNCQSQSEFVENAIRFYAGYLAAKDASEYLVPVLTQVLRGLLESFFTHASTNLFRLAVEEATTWNIIAGLIQVSPAQLKRIHSKAVVDVKKLNGRLSYEQLYKDPVSLEYDLDIDSMADGEGEDE